MIKTSTQLKALVKNRSLGDSTKAQIIIRNYVMERFLERISQSEYRDSIILKGGTLIASIIGSDKRSTMDIDATLEHITLNVSNAERIVESIINIEIDDNVTFKIISVSSIMEEFDYPGIRLSLKANIDKMEVPLKVDFSTGDVITPKPIKHSYKLMFENRVINVLAYNVETILAEKFETIISRGVLNSRMRDFYDIHIIRSLEISIDNVQFIKAVMNTSKNRNSLNIVSDWQRGLSEIAKDKDMIKRWKSYQVKFDYAQQIKWEAVIESIYYLGSISGL